MEEWRRIKAYCRAPGDKPLVIRGSIASCLCDALSFGDKIRAVGRYLVISTANFVPVSGIKIFLLRFLGAQVGRDVYVSPGVVFDPLFPELITIGDGVLLGLGCRILTHEYTTRNFRLGCVRIGKDSVVGAWSTLRSGVNIGANVTIGACVFVYEDVPDEATIACAPAQEIRRKSEEDE